MLDLHRLRLLRELSARGTVRATAAALGYSPGAISQQLAVLERETGVVLFERVGRTLRLTAAGRLLATHANRLLQDAEAAQAEVVAVGAGQLTGTVRVASFQSAFIHVVAPAIAALGTTHPGIRVEATEAELEASAPDVSLQRTDIAIGDEYDGQPRAIHPDLRRETLLTESIDVVLPDEPGVDFPDRVSLASLGDRVWAGCQPGTGQHQMTLAVCRGRGGFEPDLRYTSDDFLILLQTVRVTGAAALMPHLTLIGHSDGVVARPLGPKPVSREVFLLTRSSPTAAVEVVVAALRAATADVMRRERSIARTVGRQARDAVTPTRSSPGAWR